MKYFLSLYWITDTEMEVEADSEEEAVKKGFQEIDDLSIGKCSFPSVNIMNGDLD